MKDIQSQYDDRRISIKKVGVKNIAYPITVLDKSAKVQKTVATVNMYVNLPHQFKGTHMSRFIEILNTFHGEINLRNFHLVLEEMKKKLQAEASHIEIEFPYFLKKKSQTANGVSIDEYLCKMHGSLETADALSVEIHVPIAPPRAMPGNEGLPRSLGHWGMAIIAVNFKQFIWIEDLIQLVNEATAHQLGWADMKDASREDHYLSVENMTKAIGDKLADHPSINAFQVRVENFSQGFSTFAILAWPET